MALLLACARRVVSFANATRHGAWDVKSGRPIFRVRGQTLGLVGFGRNGRALAGKAQGFGLKMIIYDPWVTAEAVAPYGAKTDDLDALLRASDFVSIHVPLTEATRGLINARTLRLMKPSAYLINTSRGPIIDEPALVQALRAHWIAGAALDVLVKEPGEQSTPLFGLDNAIGTPHASL
jgi:D-3-phosphoglycerate dehydrogenase